MGLFLRDVKKEAREGRGVSCADCRGGLRGASLMSHYSRVTDSMITAYLPENGMLHPVSVARGEPIPESAVWIDALSPDDDDLTFLDKTLNLDVPTQEDMKEIEMSSRLYQEEDALYMTATMVCQADTPEPSIMPVTFV